VSGEEGAALSGAPGQIELVVSQGVEAFLPMAGLFDAAKEVERLQKQASKVEKELEGLQVRFLGGCVCGQGGQVSSSCFLGRKPEPQRQNKKNKENTSTPSCSSVNPPPPHPPPPSHPHVQAGPAIQQEVRG
jgi:hypothetical protein